jgi:diaminopimelate decarboxylase
MIMELGRYIVGEAGLYVARILYRKVSRSEVFFVTDGGLHHHLVLSGNFGQVIRKKYPVLNANRSRAGLAPATIVGRLCTPLDRMGDRVNIPTDTRAGDLVAVFQFGAYGATASPVAFLGHSPAAEILI